MKRITKAQFKVLVGKAGSTKKAAEIMGVTASAVTNHAKHGHSLSLARVRKLQRVVDDGYTEGGEQPAVHQDHVVLTPDELRSVVRYRASECEEGWQRKLNPVRVAQIEDQIRKGVAKLPPVMLGRLPDDTLVEIDGQHRSEGHIAAGVACHAVVFDVADIEECRQLFLSYGGRVVPINTRDRYCASRNPLKKVLEGWEVVYGADQSQVCALARGLIGRLAVDFVDPTKKIDNVQKKRGQTILEVWAGSTRWRSSAKKAKKKTKKKAKKKAKKKTKKASVYSSPRMLQALGMLCQDYGDDTMVRLALDVIQSYHRAFTSPGLWWRTAKDGNIRDLVDALRAYVTPRLLGGSGTRRNG